VTPEFEEDPPRQPAPADTLVVSFESWEGPLDLLLSLARAQKIDLAAIPILPLVDQYLAFIAAARSLKLEIAADYLVMAAWLAYLKSALLLPRDAAPEPCPSDLAQRLRWRLQRLEAMRAASRQLFARDLLGRDVLRRGRPEGLRQVRTSKFEAGLYDLLAAYGALHGRARATVWTPPARGPVVTLEEALERLASLIGQAPDWTDLRRFLPDGMEPDLARSALASSFVAMLELARIGRAEVSQAAAFGPIMLRARTA